MLKQDRMTLEFHRPVEEISVSCKPPAPERSQALRHINHLRIELPNPLHLIFFIQRLRLYHIRTFYNHVAVHTLSLPLWNNSKYKAYEFIARLRLLHPQKLQLAQQTKLSIQLPKPLI